MGEVYEALYLGQKVAVKTIKGISGPPDKKSKLYTDLVTELEILATIGRHPNIVGFIGAVTNSRPLLVMELVAGPTLESFLHADKGKKVVLKNATVAGWSRGLLSAVAHLHERDPIIIHRDCKCTPLCGLYM
jgi:serine/threonine protein kinase